jgi:hypothetical protein
MKTTRAQPMGNSSSLTPRASSEGVDSGVGADRTTIARNAPPKMIPITTHEVGPVKCRRSVVWLGSSGVTRGQVEHVAA